MFMFVHIATKTTRGVAREGEGQENVIISGLFVLLEYIC